MARFLHLSDLHLLREGTRASGVLDTAALLRTAIDRLLGRLDGLGPLDAVLVSGDISDDGSAESYAIARRELDRLGLPLLVVPGNHDARDPFRHAFRDLPTMPPAGPIDWHARIADTHVIGLDTLVEGQGGGRLAPESLAFLRHALNETGASPVVLMLHHPPLQTGIRFMDAIGLENTAELGSALTDARVPVEIISGHVHGIHHGRLGRHRIATAPAVCSAFVLDRRPGAPVGFYTGPTGCALLDTGAGGLWSHVPLDPADGPFPF